MMVVLHAALLIALAWITGRKQPKPFLLLFGCAWIIKILAGMVMGWIHMQYYPDSDTFQFYQQATELARLMADQFPVFVEFIISSESSAFTGEGRSLFFVKLLSLLAAFTGNNFWLMSVWISVISFYASWYLYRVIVALHALAKWPAAIAFLFFPSAVCWTSGLFKETLAVAGMYVVVAVFLKIWGGLKMKWWDYVLVIPALAVAWTLKYYMVGLAIPLMVAACMVRLLVQDSRLTEKSGSLLIVLITALLLVLPGFFHPNLRPHRVIAVALENRNLIIGQHKDKVRLISHEVLEPSWSAALRYAPEALFAGLYAPWKPEAPFGWYTLAVIESWVLLLLTALAAAGFAMPKKISCGMLIAMAVMYCLLMALFLGWAVPSAGTLVRYRAAFLSWWVLLLLMACQQLWSKVRPVEVKIAS